MAGTIKSDTVRFGTTEISYLIRRSPERSTIGITVCGPWIEVAVPSGMRATAIRPHIEKKGAWILQKLDLTRRHGPIYPQVLRAGDSIRFFGRQHLLRIHFDSFKRSRLEMKARQFHLHLAPDTSPESGHAFFKNLFRKHLEMRLPSWLSAYAAKLRIQVPDFRIRELGNRWGSCSHSGILQFHWLLATQSPSFIQHVVAHELCHLLEPSHSKTFFGLMQKIHPK